MNVKWASLVAQTVKHLPAMQETGVRSLGWEDTQEGTLLKFLFPGPHITRLWTQDFFLTLIYPLMSDVKVKVLVTQSCLILWDPMDHSLPGSSIHGFSREEYWRGLPFPSPGDLPNPGIEPRFPALQTDSLPLSHQGSPLNGKAEFIQEYLDRYRD